MAVLKHYRKFGKWSIQLWRPDNTDTNVPGRAHIVITDDWVTDYPMFYGAGQAVAFDNPHRLPKSVKEWVNKNQVRLMEDVALARKASVKFSSRPKPKSRTRK